MAGHGLPISEVHRLAHAIFKIAFALLLAACPVGVVAVLFSGYAPNLSWFVVTHLASVVVYLLLLFVVSGAILAFPAQLEHHKRNQNKG